MEALADFFPASEWSEMQSSLEKRKNQPEMTPEQIGMAVAFTKMDPDVQKDVMSIARQEMEEGGSLPLSPDGQSAPDPDATPPTPAENSPENVESIPEDLASETSG